MLLKTQSNLMLDKYHSAIPWPAVHDVGTEDIVVGRIWIGTEILLDEISGLVHRKMEQNVQSFDITGIQINRMVRLHGRITVLWEVIGHLRRPHNFTSM